jgi:hypothetical protein
MARFRRTLYGWLAAPGVYALGKQPPDPVPYQAETFGSIQEAEAQADMRRAVIVWSGPALIEKQSRAQRMS